MRLPCQDGGVDGRDALDNERYGLAPALAIGLGTPTRLYLYSQHVRHHNLPDGGVPTVGLDGYYSAALPAGAQPARVDPENFYGSRHDDFEKMQGDMFSSRLEHDLNAHNRLRNSTRYGEASVERLLTSVNALVVPSGQQNTPDNWLVELRRHSNFQDNRLLVNQTQLNSDFVLAGIQHALAAGVEFMHEQQDSPGYTSARANANLYHPDPALRYAPETPSGAVVHGRTDTIAAYLFDTLSLSEHWLVNAGLRLDRYDTRSTGVRLSTSSDTGLPVGTPLPYDLSNDDQLSSWKLGAVYKPIENASLYLAYADAYTPPGSSNLALSANPVSTTPGSSVNNANPALDAQHATTIEIGGKWEPLDQGLLLSAAWYQSDNDGELAEVSDSHEIEQFGARRVEGFEFSAVGALTPNWQLLAGVATMSTELREGAMTGNNATGASARWSPELTATLWTSYALSEALTFAGGLRYVSEQQRVTDLAAVRVLTTMPAIPSYWVMDAMVGYTLAQHWTLQLNIQNVSDEDYIASLNNNGNRYNPGAPRSYWLTLSYQL